MRHSLKWMLVLMLTSCSTFLAIPEKVEYSQMLVYIDGNHSKAYKPRGIEDQSTVWRFSDDTITVTFKYTDRVDTFKILRRISKRSGQLYTVAYQTPAGQIITMEVYYGYGFTEVLKPVFIGTGKDKIRYVPYQIYFKEKRHDK